MVSWSKLTYNGRGEGGREGNKLEQKKMPFLALVYMVGVVVIPSTLDANLCTAVHVSVKSKLGAPGGVGGAIHRNPFFIHMISITTANSYQRCIIQVDNHNDREKIPKRRRIYILL